MATFTEVGAYEAKTHLSDFLRKVKAGAVIRITQRGEHVADLVPPETTRVALAVHALVMAAGVFGDVPEVLGPG